MELRHLRYFVAVAEEQNVTRAARRLHVSQPPLSRQIRDLEEELGLPLFEHGARSVRLTQAGRVFLVEARAALQRVDEAVQTVKAVAGGVSGEIHLAYAVSLTVEILPLTLRFFQQTNPGVRVQLHEASTQEMLRGLRDGDFQASLMIEVPPKALPPDLVFEELRRYPVAVALHPAHRLARARKVGVDQLARERLVAFTLAGYPEYHLWLTGLLAPVNRRPQIVEEHDSAVSLIAAVEAGRGVALVSQSFNCLAGPRLKVRPLDPAPPPVVVGVAYRRPVDSKATEALLAAARQSKAALVQN
jgi:DNA-binding transcriptional LysR family regulator